MHEAPDARILGRREQVARAVDHDALEVALASLTDRHQMDDGLGTLDSSTETGRIGQVPLNKLGAPGPELRPVVGVPDEGADGQVAAAKLVHDVAAHEPGPPGDEDQPAGSR